MRPTDLKPGAGFPAGEASSGHAHAHAAKGKTQGQDWRPHGIVSRCSGISVSRCSAPGHFHRSHLGAAAIPAPHLLWGLPHVHMAATAALGPRRRALRFRRRTIRPGASGGRRLRPVARRHRGHSLAVGVGRCAAIAGAGALVAHPSGLVCIRACRTDDHSAGGGRAFRRVHPYDADGLEMDPAASMASSRSRVRATPGRGARLARLRASPATAANGRAWRRPHHRRNLGGVAPAALPVPRDAAGRLSILLRPGRRRKHHHNLAL